jgi:hypothetical protein
VRSGPRGMDCRCDSEPLAFICATSGWVSPLSCFSPPPGWGLLPQVALASCRRAGTSLTAAGLSEGPLLPVTSDLSWEEP